MMQIKYTRHARRRMRWRKISELEVEQTLKNPDKIDFQQEGRKNAFKRLGLRYIRVTYCEQGNSQVIISVVDKLD